MRYLLLIYGDEQALAEWTPERATRNLEDYAEFTRDVIDRGWMEGGEPLQPSATATTVRVKDGEVLTTDGPYAETKEQLGGFYLLRCDDLDQAIDAASRIPFARDGIGAIEIRPVMELPEGYPRP